MFNRHEARESYISRKARKATTLGLVLATTLPGAQIVEAKNSTSNHKNSTNQRLETKENKKIAAEEVARTQRLTRNAMTWSARRGAARIINMLARPNMQSHNIEEAPEFGGAKSIVGNLGWISYSHSTASGTFDNRLSVRGYLSSDDNGGSQKSVTYSFGLDPKDSINRANTTFTLAGAQSSLRNAKLINTSISAAKGVNYDDDIPKKGYSLQAVTGQYNWTKTPTTQTWQYNAFGGFQLESFQRGLEEVRSVNTPDKLLLLTGSLTEAASDVIGEVEDFAEKFVPPPQDCHEPGC